MVWLESISEAEKDAFINQLAELLPNLQQDPTPIVHLIEYLIRASTFTFSRVLAIKPAIDFVAGLSSPIPSINLITLCLLSKASLSKSDSDIVAGQPNVVATLVRLWLRTEDTGVAQRSLQTLVELLTVGTEGMSNGPSINEDLMWRRLFRDRDIYGSIFALCSLKTIGRDGQLSKLGKTHAQGRLLNLLVEIDSEPVRRSQFPEIERMYGVTDGGLLTFATMHMIDFEDDILMHVTLINFFADFLRSPSPMSDSSRALDFLVETGLHSRTVSFFVDPGESNPPILDFLYGPSAQYIEAYVSSFPSHLLRSSSLLESILDRLSTNFEGMISISEIKTQVFWYDLLVFRSLPEAALRNRPLLQDLAAAINRVKDDQGHVSRATVEDQVLTLER